MSIAKSLSATPIEGSAIKKLLSNKLLQNALLFQTGWFACVLGGDAIALLSLVLICFIHARFFVAKRSEWILITLVLLCGICVDNILAWQGIFSFGDHLNVLLIPLWLACLWALFATTLLHSLSWLNNRLLLASAFGALLAPLSYLGGGKLAGVQLMEPTLLSLIVIGFCWALLMPLFFIVARRLP